MDYNELLEKLVERINRIGIISRAWNDEETLGILKNIEKSLKPTNGFMGLFEYKTKIEKLKEIPSVKFYNLHIPHGILNEVYTPTEMVEYTKKNQKRLSSKEVGFIGNKVIESNDSIALGMFTSNIKIAGKSAYVNAVINKNDPNLMLEVIPGVNGENFDRLQQKILDSKNLNSIYKLSQVKDANLLAIKDAIVESNNVEYMYRLAEEKNRNGKFIMDTESRRELFENIIDNVIKMDLNSIVRYTNKFKKDYSEVIAKRFMENCKNPKDFILYALTTGYGREEATEKVAKSRDVKLICDVLTVLASKEKSKGLHTHCIDVDKLVEGLLNAVKQNVVENGNKITKLINKLESRIKNKENLIELNSYLNIKSKSDEKESD